MDPPLDDGQLEALLSSSQDAESFVDDQLPSLNNAEFENIMMEEPRPEDQPLPTIEHSTKSPSDSPIPISTLPAPVEQVTSRPNFFNPVPQPLLDRRPSLFGPAGPSNPAPDAATSVNPAANIKDEESPVNIHNASTPPRDAVETSSNEDGESLPVLPSSNAIDNVEPASTSPAGSDNPISAQQVALNIEIDDDLMEIDEAAASAAARLRWSEPRQPTILNNNEVTSIKKEPKDNTPIPSPMHRRPSTLSRRSPPSTLPGAPPRGMRPLNISRPTNMSGIVAAQRAMLQKTVHKKSSASVPNRIRKPSPPPVVSTKKRRRSNPVVPVPDDPAQIDAAMRDGEEDHSWMRESDNDSQERDEEYQALKDREKLLERREKNGKITRNEEMELFRLKKQLRTQDRLRAAARGETVDGGLGHAESEEGLFVPHETREQVIERHRKNRPPERDSPSPEANDEDADDEQFTSQEIPDEAFRRMLQQAINGEGVEGVPTEKEMNAKPRKPRKKVAKTAREVREREREKEREKLQKQKAKKAARPKAKKAKGKAAKGKGKGKAANNGVVAQRDSHTQFAKRQNGMDEVGQMILNDLMSHDPILDRMVNPIFLVDAEPEISGSNTKETQLQKLFANIPEGSNVKSAKNDQKKLKQASKSFGYAKVKAVDGKWLVKGMTSTLYHHQLLGAQWMVSRELSDTAPHGGLLADGMGLGKTVQTLACMVGNPPTPADIKRNIRATLIVVPSTVIDQWLEEIRRHAEESVFPKIMHYKSSSKIPTAVLSDLDIVLTSYTEVMRQFPFPDQKARESIAQMGYKKWWKNAAKCLGDLHKVQWYRVVLDEAHAIKNNSARTSLACQNLKSVYRWCLTGTPLLNRLEE